METRDMEQPPPRELYALLHLSPEASEEDIKRAYRQWAQIYHPDKHQTVQDFVQEAVQVCSHGSFGALNMTDFLEMWFAKNHGDIMEKKLSCKWPQEKYVPKLVSIYEGRYQMQRNHGEKNGGRNPPDKAECGNSNTEGRDRSSLPAGARIERFSEKGYLGASKTASGVLSRTSPLAGSPGPEKQSNKSVAFTKPASTVIPVEVSQAGGPSPNPIASASPILKENLAMGKSSSLKSNMHGASMQS